MSDARNDPIEECGEPSWQNGFVAFGDACMLFAFTLGTAIHTNAQTLFGSIVGTVTDPTGAAVPGATVQVTELQTNTTRSAETNEGGLYALSTLPPGVYKLTVSKAAFGGYTNPRSEVASNTIARVDIEMKVGGVTEQIEVRTDNALLQTDRADVHTQRSAETFQNAPQPTRTYQGVLNLVPGMVPPGGQQQVEPTIRPSPCSLPQMEREHRDPTCASRV